MGLTISKQSKPVYLRRLDRAKRQAIGPKRRKLRTYALPASPRGRDYPGCRHWRVHKPAHGGHGSNSLRSQCRRPGSIYRIGGQEPFSIATIAVKIARYVVRIAKRSSIGTKPRHVIGGLNGFQIPRQIIIDLPCLFLATCLFRHEVRFCS